MAAEPAWPDHSRGQSRVGAIRRVEKGCGRQGNYVRGRDVNGSDEPGPFSQALSRVRQARFAVHPVATRSKGNGWEVTRQGKSRLGYQDIRRFLCRMSHDRGG